MCLALRPSGVFQVKEGHLIKVAQRKVRLGLVRVGSVVGSMYTSSFRPNQTKYMFMTKHKMAAENVSFCEFDYFYHHCTET